MQVMTEAVSPGTLREKAGTGRPECTEGHSQGERYGQGPEKKDEGPTQGIVSIHGLSPVNAGADHFDRAAAEG